MLIGSSVSLRRTVAALAALSMAGSAFAFADDDARRAILELRETIKTMQADLSVSKNAQMQLMTEIKLNLPAMKQTLQRMNGAAAGKFHLLKSPGELRDFAEKLEKLRVGMPPEEVLAEMGKPDRSFSADTWDPERKRQKETIFQYDFLRRKEKAESRKQPSAFMLLQG